MDGGDGAGVRWSGLITNSHVNLDREHGKRMGIAAGALPGDKSDRAQLLTMGKSCPELFRRGCFALGEDDLVEAPTQGCFPQARALRPHFMAG